MHGLNLDKNNKIVLKYKFHDESFYFYDYNF